MALACALLVFGCSGREINLPPKATGLLCHIIYDAGSKGTRLYIYHESNSGWVKHKGPRFGALADPVLVHRGNTMADVDAVVDDVVNALERTRTDGPVNVGGEPGWLGFDWREVCQVQSVSVYATAGMRLAEQKSMENSRLLWNKLNERLSQEVGIEVTTRTLSGYEEGLFAWLAISQHQPDLDFGTAEMGGGSLQITFPCAQCDRTREVKVGDEKVAIYSHSYLGWGQDEAWRNFGDSLSCKLGAARRVQDWKVSDCPVGLAAFQKTAVETLENIELANPGRWVLNDAFRYMKSDDVEKYCRQGDDTGYEPESACFRAVFLRGILQTLGLPMDSPTSEADWTLGAVMCAATQCLDAE